MYCKADCGLVITVQWDPGRYLETEGITAKSSMEREGERNCLWLL